MMHRHSHSSHRSQSKFIKLDTHLCQACWTCVEACPNGVLDKINLPFHKHARIRDAQACKGCLKCVKACPHQAIIALKQDQSRYSQHKATYTKQIES
jgi:NAD-dependent dihydropyrimidine dehydrogenase PreA subunit